MKNGYLIAGLFVVLLMLSKQTSTMDTLKQLITREEGLRLTAYQDTGGVWTIGYGHVIRATDGLYPYTNKRAITKEEADAFFNADTADAVRAVNNVRVPINDSKRLALISLVYNIGVNAFNTSTLLKKLNAGDVQGAANEFLRWIYDDGVINPVLQARRDRERELFLA